MADVTALDLVNRVLVYHRFDEVTDFTRNEAKTALQVVNMAIDKVLNSNDWEFSKRHDGILITSGTVTSDSGSSGNLVHIGGAVFNISQSVTTGTTDRYTRIINQQDSDAVGDIGQQGISYGVDIMRDAGGIMVVGLDSTWLGSSGTSADWMLYTAEYVLPTYVRGVISATDQISGLLNICMVSPEVRLEEILTNSSGYISDQTRTIFQGGTLLATSAEDPRVFNYGPRIILYPIPETSFRIDYSYWYLYPQLSDPTDELEGITDSAIHDVVNYAYAHSNLTGIGNDPKLGAALKQDTRREINQNRTSEKAAMSYDGRITPWGSIPNRHPARNPRHRWDSQTIEEP